MVRSILFETRKSPELIAVSRGLEVVHHESPKRGVSFITLERAAIDVTPRNEILIRGPTPWRRYHRS